MRAVPKITKSLELLKDALNEVASFLNGYEIPEEHCQIYEKLLDLCKKELTGKLEPHEEEVLNARELNRAYLLLDCIEVAVMKYLETLDLKPDKYKEVKDAYIDFREEKYRIAENEVYSPDTKVKIRTSGKSAFVAIARVFFILGERNNLLDRMGYEDAVKIDIRQLLSSKDMSAIPTIGDNGFIDLSNKIVKEKVSELVKILRPTFLQEEYRTGNFWSGERCQILLNQVLHESELSTDVGMASVLRAEGEVFDNYFPKTAIFFWAAFSTLYAEHAIQQQVNEGKKEINIDYYIDGPLRPSIFILFELPAMLDKFEEQKEKNSELTLHINIKQLNPELHMPLHAVDSLKLTARELAKRQVEEEGIEQGTERYKVRLDELIEERHAVIDKLSRKAQETPRAKEEQSLSQQEAEIIRALTTGSNKEINIKEIRVKVAEYKSLYLATHPAHPYSKPSKPGML